MIQLLSVALQLIEGADEMREVKESDWKLFRKKLPEWQEAYMGKLNAGYAALLAAPGAAYEKFWELESGQAKGRRGSGNAPIPNGLHPCRALARRRRCAVRS